MSKLRKVWKLSSVKSPKSTVPESIKEDLLAKATHLIEYHLKTRYVLPPRKDIKYNYVTNISGKWNRSYFYFIAIFACPGPNAISPTFERKFARMEYVGEGNFTLAYLRHTGTWFEISAELSMEDSLKAIQDDPCFQL